MKPTSGFHRGAYAAYGNGVFEIDECRHCGMERKPGLWGEYGPVGKQDLETTAYRHREYLLGASVLAAIGPGRGRYR